MGTIYIYTAQVNNSLTYSIHYIYIKHFKTVISIAQIPDL